MNRVYNLLIYDKKSEKVMVHSWSDSAPTMIENGSGVEKIDLKIFSCVSNLTQTHIDRFSDKLQIIPSTYILENWDDHSHINFYKNKPKNLNKIFFNGLWHHLRVRVLTTLRNNNSELFVLKDKRNGDYKQKKEYFEEVSNYKYGLSLKGRIFVIGTWNTLV